MKQCDHGNDYFDEYNGCRYCKVLEANPELTDDDSEVIGGLMSNLHSKYCQWKVEKQKAEEKAIIEDAETLQSRIYPKKHYWAIDQANCILYKFCAEDSRKKFMIEKNGYDGDYSFFDSVVPFPLIDILRFIERTHIKIEIITID